MEQDHQPKETWRVGKELSLALIFAMVTQSGAWIWWAATQSAKLDTLTSMVADFRSSQYTQNDARRDMEIIMSRHQENRRRIEVLEAQRPLPKTRYLKDYQ